MEMLEIGARKEPLIRTVLGLLGQPRTLSVIEEVCGGSLITTGVGVGDVGADAREIINSTVAVAVSFRLSVTVKLTVLVPAILGVPLMRPADERVRPAGSA